MSNHTNKDLYYQNLLINRHVGGYADPQLESVNQYIHEQQKVLGNGNQKLPPDVRYFQNNMSNNPGNNIKSNYENQNQQNNSLNYSLNDTLNSTYSYGCCGGSSMPPVTNSFNTFNNNSGYNGSSRKKDVYLRKDLDKYDPYDGFLYKKGLMSDGYQKRRTKSIFIDVNSDFRDKKPSIVTEPSILLQKDPLEFQNDSSIITIKHKNSGFEVNDPITLSDAISKSSILRTFRDINQPTFDIPPGCNIMKIYYDHGIPTDYTGDTIMVILNGIKGDRGSADSSGFLGSMPTNVINTIHTLKLTLTNADMLCTIEDIVTLRNDPGYFGPSPNFFFVVLPVVMQQSSNQSPVPYTLRDYNFKLIFQSLYGIPLNQINATYPTDPLHLYGYHVIRSVTNDGYTINVPTKASVLGILGAKVLGGGNSVYVSRITTVNPGYPDPNSYKINLGKVFHNVITMRLVSSEIPNTEKAIKNTPVSKANNKIYWNDIDDGDYLYSVSIPPGNYNPSDLITALGEQFAKTPRIGAIDPSQKALLGITYTSTHFIQITINQNTDEVIFKSYKETVLPIPDSSNNTTNPIIEVIPDIPDSSIITVDADTTYQLTIQHENHGMTVPGQIILIQNAIAHKGIPATVINGEHIVTEILNVNTYRISLPRFNLLDDRTETGGGSNVFIYIPDTFRLRFDQPDTLGKVLGFRNPGDLSSVYDYASIISNNDPYAFETEENALGQPIIIKNNALQFSGDNYIIMVAEPIKTFYTMGKVKDAFAKIILCDSPGQILYNTFVPIYHVFDDPLNELYELTVSFYSPDGILFDFNGVEHSYTLEVVIVNDIPDGTGISASTGKNYNQEIR